MPLLTTPGKSLASILMTLMISACAGHTQTTNLSPAIATASHEQLLQHSDALYNPVQLQHVLASLQNTTDMTQWQQGLFYLRGYSYFGPFDKLTDTDFQAIADALTRLPQQANFSMDEQFAVTLYLYFTSDQQAGKLAPLLPRLAHQLSRLGKQTASEARDYALWETIRAYGFLLNQSRQRLDGQLNKLLLQQHLDADLLGFVAGDRSPWERENAYWALAMYRLALTPSKGKQADDAPTPEQLALDKQLEVLALKDIATRGDAGKDSYTLGYHVNHFGGQLSCQEKTQLCRIPDLLSVLPQRHRCSESLFIVAQDLSTAEFAESCQRLTSQESHFHSLLKTEQQPTTNDHNQALQVVAFKNWSQYNAYGQLLFDIGTDNGGMYIEGTPQQPGNQASFFAFRQFWIAPEFAIWNLNHEYVHYLDGRFVKYGGFGHFPGKMVWWAEGLAEYISKGETNPKAIDLATEALEQKKALDLASIFATEYQDGQDRTYRWSYLAIRFLAEQEPQALVRLSQALKMDYFAGYEQELTALTSKEPAFQQWLQQLAQTAKNNDADTTPSIRKLNRYSYRDYLQPAHLSSSGRHQHY
ncbi:collagenase [Shewanella algae]